MDRLTISTTFFFLALINALPIPNYSDRLVWANTPDTRGTLTIVFSCGAALLLCIWSGIHSNVNPNADDGEKKGAKLMIAKVVGKAALASIALLAPDIVLTVALHQLLVALQYQEALNAPEDQPVGTDETQREASTNGLDNTRKGDGTAVDVKTDTTNQPDVSVKELGASQNGDGTDHEMITDAKSPAISVKELDAGSNDTAAAVPDRVTTDEKIQEMPTNETHFSISSEPTITDGRPPNGRHDTVDSHNSKDTQVTEPIRANTRRSKISTVMTGKSRMSKKDGKESRIGLKMSFFATMGGFCFSETTIQGFHRRSLAFDTLLHPKTMEIIRKQPLSDIEDKSKASGIAKTVAAFQIFWIILQVLGRYIGRLHITLLELNTCIHVVLAILTYAIWFRKPLDVDISIPAVRNKLIHDFATTFYIHRMQIVLREAEKCIMRNSTFLKFVSDSQQPSTAPVNTIYHGSNSDPIASQHPKILAAMVISQAMKEVPEEASNIFYASHASVKACLARETLQHEVIPAILAKDNSGNSGVGSELLQIKLLDAAYGMVSDISSKVAHEQTMQNLSFTPAIQRAYSKLRDPEIKDTKYRDILNDELRTVMHEALDKTRARSVEKSFVQVSLAAQNIFGNKGNLAFPDLVQSSVQRSAQACCRAASRHAVRHEALKAVVGTQNVGDAVEAALYKFRNKCHPQQSKDSAFDHFFDSLVNTAKSEATKAFDRYIKIEGFELDTNIAVTADIVSRYAARGILFAVKQALSEIKDNPNGNSDPPTPLISSNTSPTIPVGVNTVSVRKFTTSELEDCTDALREIVSSRIWKYMNPETSQSLWADIKYPFANAAGVLRNQLVDVPNLFTPREQTQRRTVPKYSRLINSNRHGSNGGDGIRNDDNADNQHFDKSWCKKHRMILLSFSALAGIFYGSIHITKWNSMWFPTLTEHLLWNISCCVGSVAVLPIGLSMLIPFLEGRPIRRRLCILLCTISWVLFGAARVYFIGESFLSLRSLPSSAYRSVQWSNNLPHF